MARRHGFEMRLIAMTNTHHAEMKELVVGKDLAWMDGAPIVREPEARFRLSGLTSPSSRRRGRRSCGSGGR